MTAASPYAGESESNWKRITEVLLAQHPLKPDVIEAVAMAAWMRVWETTVGSGAAATPLKDLDVPATVIGYFFEVLFAKEMQIRFPGTWRGSQRGDEKDLVFVADPRLSVEIKTSGQLGTRIYGNRSYGQELENEQLAKKEKSGYYLTVNFYDRTMTLLRFGWIDARDWKPQSSPTGQMAGLSDSVYAHKLVVIPGNYRLQAPARLLRGIGSKLAEQLSALNIKTIKDLIEYSGPLPTRLASIRDEARSEYGGL